MGTSHTHTHHTHTHKHSHTHIHTLTHTTHTHTHTHTHPHTHSHTHTHHKHTPHAHTHTHTTHTHTYTHTHTHHTHTHTHTHTCLVLNSFLNISDFRMAIAELTFLSLFDKWEFGYCSYCHLKVTDWLQSWETRRVCACRLFCSLWLVTSYRTLKHNVMSSTKKKLHCNFWETFCYALIQAQREDCASAFCVSWSKWIRPHAWYRPKQWTIVSGFKPRYKPNYKASRTRWRPT